MQAWEYEDKKEELSVRKGTMRAGLAPGERGMEDGVDLFDLLYRAALVRAINESAVSFGGHNAACERYETLLEYERKPASHGGAKKTDGRTKDVEHQIH